MNRRIWQVILVASLHLVLIPSSAFGQTERGAIVGTVTDALGAVVADATVTVTNLSTTVSQTYKTNSEGFYEAPFLTPGVYQVSAQASGFSRAINSNVTVNVGARVRVDLPLQAGSVTEQVEVSDAAPLVQTEHASIGQVIDNKVLTELPSGDRNIYSFILLSSNVTQPPGGNAPAFRLESGGSFSISGTRPSSVTFKVDGLSNTDPAFGTPTITPSLESVQEFNLQTNAYSAEYEGIGQVNVATKAGSRQFHGTMFEFLRNDALQPRNPIAPLDKTGRPGKNKLRFNQFGGTIGGPIWLPKEVFGPAGYDGRERTFFFFSYEGRRSNSLGLATTRVPTLAERAGDFSANLGGCTSVGGVPVPLLNPAGAPTGDCVRVGQIFDPATTVANPRYDSTRPVSAFNPQFIRQPFPNNRIPDGRLSAVARSLIDFQLPPPNLAAVDNNFIGPAGAVFDNDQYSGRIDHTFSDRDRIYGRLAFQNNLRITQPTIILTQKNVQGQGRVFNSTWTHVFSSTTINEFRLGYVRGVYGDSIDTLDPAQFGFNNTFLATLPRIFLSAGNLNYGGFSGSVLAEVQNTYQVADNLSLILGTHSLKAGFKLDHNRFKNGELGNNAGGTGTFSGIYTTPSNGFTAIRDHSLADFLLGLAQMSALAPPAIANLRNTPWSVYVQDDWKAAPRITLNLGLRYELHQPYREQTLGGSRIDFSNGGRLIVADPEVARLSNTPLVVCCTEPRVVDTDKNDFAPRIGLAIQPFKNDNLVIRAGYGIFYSDMTTFFAWRQYEPLRGTRFTTQNGDFLRPGATLDNLFPSSAFTSGGGLTTSFGPVPREILGNRPFLPAISALGSNETPYAQEWSLSIQREVFRDLLLEVNYTGSNSKNLPTQWIFSQALPSPVPVNNSSPDPAANPYLRRPYPNFNIGAFAVANLLQSNYNAMTVKVDKRFSKGFSLLSTYTWSKSIDQGSEVFQLGQTFGIIADNNNINLDRGLSTFDVPHRWVTSGIAELPFGKGKPYLNRGGWVDKLLGGFRFSGVFTLQSGFPFTPLIRNRLSNTAYALATERGDLVGEPYFSDAEWQQRVRDWETGTGRLFVINPASIGLNYAPGTFGNIPRNFFRAPYGRALDLALAKITRLGEVTRFELRADILNVTNERLHRLDIANNVFANNVLTNPLVGSIPERRFLFNPRVIQLGLKFIF
jgi:hypothetical protein